MTREMFINAVNDMQLPQYVTVDHVEYPAPDEAEDYEGTAPQYWNNMNRKRIYNRVMDDRSGVCPLGELLTDKELERMHLHNSRRDWPNTAKVTVKTGEIYFSFGVRFAESYELIKPGE